jgi:hypothetical protein
MSPVDDVSPFSSSCSRYDDTIQLRLWEASARSPRDLTSAIWRERCCELTPHGKGRRNRFDKWKIVIATMVTIVSLAAHAAYIFDSNTTVRM